ncbi:Adhesion G-protein coupled receptor G4 [Holothuria leucospilota]|uniref:Adhesion G-protein coupled receptor G4 n=1 Tax=Holothuria leucospilota TaxID=206669 RepID=A0A9Q1CLM5_HOLLE|nr:Adhesion G-protein coupled receptor G4 [Holothuria leucospilota]
MEPLGSPPSNLNSMEPFGSSPPDLNSMEPVGSPPPNFNSMEPLRSPPPDFNSMQPLRSPPPDFNSMEPFRSPPPDFSSMQPLRSSPSDFNSMTPLRSPPPDFNGMQPFRSAPPDFNGMEPLRSPPQDFNSMQPLHSLPPDFNTSVTFTFQEEIKLFPALMVLSMIQGGRENTAVTRNLLQTDLNVLFEQSRCSDSFRSIENITVISNGPSFLVRFDFRIQLGDRCTTFDYISSFNSTLTGPNQDTFGNKNVVVKESFSFDLITERVNLTFRTEDGLDTQAYLDPFSPEALTLERNIIVAFKDLSSSIPTFSHATFIPPFIRGSLIGVFSLSFLQSTPISTRDLRSTLGNLRRQGNFNFPGFTLQTTSVEEVCPATLICLNGGVCVPDSSFRSMCSCTPDWQGARCQRPVITLENVATASGMYASMTQQTNPMNVTVDDVETAAEVVQDIVSLGVTDMQTTQNVVQIVNNVLNANESVIMEATSTQGQITRSLEQQLINVNISQDESFSVSLPNVAVEALDVAPQNVRTFGVASFASDTEGQSSSISDQVNVIDDILTDDELVVFSSLEEVRDVHKASTYLQFPDNFADNILDQESLRAVFLVYRRPTLFNSRWLQNVNQNATQYTKSANTRVLTATLTNNGREITFVPGFIEQRFMPLETDGKIFNPVCVFWDYEADGGNGNWSSDGCYYKGMTRDGQILCRCDHLTNFAVLMDIYGQGSIDPAQEKVLEILSYVGCAVSIFGLITTITVYTSQKKIRKLQPSKILVGLCIALLGLYLSFIATAISNTIGLGKIPCSIVAAVFHFFTLNALAWMGVEGVNMYLLFVKVFDTYISNFMYKAIGFTTCVPLVAVAATVAVTREGYTRMNYCFLDRWPLIFGVITPVGVIVTVNFIIFVLVIRQLLKSKAVKKSEKVKKRQNLKRARNALSIMTLTGLTWSLGFLSLVYVLSGPIQWLFTIVNSTQGFMIFMLYCVRHPTVVTYWKRKFPCCEVEAPGYTPSNTHSNSQINPNSKSNGFTPSSVPVTSVEENRQNFGYR